MKKKAFVAVAALALMVSATQVFAKDPTDIDMKLIPQQVVPQKIVTLPYAE
ncbi:hypothetical protein P4H70_20565 [Paenibacillus ehimensis]|uniref:hypothetical protein n=1 Tax=Paenibacillus ehimensis TaxID=79264 RepID=UPI002DBF0A2F|nr:hypothetical protein [Paenibacillus ehimensis]MEC0211336.1 hypothetical protein [Paenibacillus ehimensis]